MSICPGCGQEFHQSPSRIKEGRVCCSIECRSTAARKGTEKKCEQCGKEFSSFGKPNRRFCSRQCFGLSRKSDEGKIETECGYCKNPIWIYPSLFRGPGRNFCDMACRSAAKVKAITVDCDECGKPYKALPNAIAKFGRRFCSVQCSSNSKKRGVEKTCPICDTKFWCQAHREASNRGTFCSIKCYRVGSMTRPERIVDDWLEARGVARERQKKFRIGFVDFFVPHANMVIAVS